MLNKIEEANEIAEDQQSVEKWKKVGDIALLAGYFSLAEQCFKKSQDYNSLLMFYSSIGDQAGLKYLLDEAEKEGKLNIAYEVAYLLALPEKCVEILTKSKRYSEAAMFARSYIPECIPKVMKEWEDVLKQSSLPFIPENIFESKDHRVIMS
jgi:coatomer subunit beta'